MADNASGTSTTPTWGSTPFNGYNCIESKIENATCDENGFFYLQFPSCSLQDYANCFEGIAIEITGVTSASFQNKIRALPHDLYKFCDSAGNEKDYFYSTDGAVYVHPKTSVEDGGKFKVDGAKYRIARQSGSSKLLDPADSALGASSTLGTTGIILINSIDENAVLQIVEPRYIDLDFTGLADRPGEVEFKWYKSTNDSSTPTYSSTGSPATTSAATQSNVYNHSIKLEATFNEDYNPENYWISYKPKNKDTMYLTFKESDTGQNNFTKISDYVWVYEFKNIEDHASFSAPPMKKYEFTVKFKEIGGGAVFKNEYGVTMNEAVAQIGSKIIFSVEPKEEHHLSNMKIFISKNELESTDPDPTGGMLVTGDGLKTVSVPDGSSTLACTDSGKIRKYEIEIKDLSNLFITVKGVKKNQYEISIPYYTLGIKFWGGKYVPVTTGEGKTELIWDPDSTAFDKDKKAFVDYGSNYSFKIKLDAAQPGYDISNIVVTANNIPLDLVDDMYTVKVLGFTEIAVTGIKKQQLNLTFRHRDGITYKNAENDEFYSTLKSYPVPYGDTFSFKIDLSGEFEVETLKVKQNNTDLPAPNTLGVYTTSAITEDTVITIDETSNLNKIEKKDYAVTFLKPTGITFCNRYDESEVMPTSNPVKHGDSLSFTVKALEGYNLDGLSVYAKPTDGEKTLLLPASGIYTLANITTDYIISAENIGTNIYKIEFHHTDGVTPLNELDKTFTSAQEVKHGGSFKFKFSLDSAYSNSVVVIQVKGSSETIFDESGSIPITSFEPGTVYSVKNIQGDKIIEITGVKKNICELKFIAEPGIRYKDIKNKTIGDGTTDTVIEVDYDTSYSFKLSLLDAYDRSNPIVEVVIGTGSKKQLFENAGLYELKNLKTDAIVSIKAGTVTVNPEDEYNKVDIPDPKDITLDNVDVGAEVQSVLNATIEYENLTDEQKQMVTNYAELKSAQQAVGRFHHTDAKSGISVGGIDWYIRLEVTIYDNLENTDVKEKIDYLNEKVERKTMLSLYEIKLYDTLGKQYYVVPYGKKIIVSIPAPDLIGYRNTVVVHETTAGGIELLDVDILNDKASFSPTSFSFFGIAAKKTPNYTENASDIMISVSGLAEEEEVFRLLGDDLVSRLGDLSKPSNIFDDIGGGGIAGNIKSAAITWYDKAYEWALENELLLVVCILTFGTICVLAIVLRNRRKEA